MKTLQLFLLSLSFICIANIASAQTKTEKIAVSGECGMCKSSIEKAAKSAGASYALWNPDAKMLTVKYSANATNTAKIETAVAGVGYDTKNVKASDEAYNKLHACCKYERSTVAADHTCADHEECKKAGCKKTDKCDAACCKSENGQSKDCCKKA